MYVLNNLNVYKRWRGGPPLWIYTDAARVFDEWFSEWFVDCAASGLLCSELLSENL